MVEKIIFKIQLSSITLASPKIQWIYYFSRSFQSLISIDIDIDGS